MKSYYVVISKSRNIGEFGSDVLIEKDVDANNKMEAVQYVMGYVSESIDDHDINISCEENAQYFVCIDSMEQPWFISDVNALDVSLTPHARNAKKFDGEETSRLLNNLNSNFPCKFKVVAL